MKVREGLISSNLESPVSAWARAMDQQWTLSVVFLQTSYNRFRFERLNFRKWNGAGRDTGGRRGHSAFRKRKCCMWYVNNVKIYSAKMGFKDCKMVQFGYPRALPQGHIPLGVIHLCMQEVKCYMWFINNMEIYIAKMGHMDCKNGF